MGQAYDVPLPLNGRPLGASTAAAKPMAESVGLMRPSAEGP